jgi:hypothetical protein
VAEVSPILERTAVISEPDFRLVRLVIDGGEYEYVLEVRDGCDAMGTERWRKFEVNGTALRSLFKFLIRIAEKEQS